MTGIAASWLDNRPSRSQPSLLLTILNQGRSYTIFDTPTRIKHLHLSQNKRLDIIGHPVEAQEWCIPYLLQDTVKIAHLLLSRIGYFVHKITFFMLLH